MIKKFFVFITLLSGSIAAVLQPLSDVPVIEVYKNGSTRFSYVCGALPDTSKTDKVLLLNRREGQWFEKTFTCKCPGSIVTESGVRAVRQFALSLKKKASFSTFFKCSWDSSKSFVIQVVFDAKETDVVIYASAKKCPKYLLEFAKAAILQRSWFAQNKYKTTPVIGIILGHRLLQYHRKFDKNTLVGISNRVAVLRKKIKTASDKHGTQREIDRLLERLETLNPKAPDGAIECSICMEPKLSDLWFLMGRSGVRDAGGRAMHACKCATKPGANPICGNCTAGLVQKNQCPFCRGGVGAHQEYQFLASGKSQDASGSGNAISNGVTFFAAPRYKDLPWAFAAVVCLMGAHLLDRGAD